MTSPTPDPLDPALTRELARWAKHIQSLLPDISPNFRAAHALFQDNPHVMEAMQHIQRAQEAVPAHLARALQGLAPSGMLEQFEKIGEQVAPLANRMEELHATVAAMSETLSRVNWPQVDVPQYARLTDPLSDIAALSEELWPATDTQEPDTIARLAGLSARLEQIDQRLQDVLRAASALPKKQRHHAEASPAFELSEIVLELRPGRHNPSLTLRRGHRRVDVGVQRLEYALLLELGSQMRQDGRRRSIPPLKQGWVHKDRLLRLIGQRSRTPEYYLNKALSVLRGKIVAAAGQLDVHVERLRVIENGARIASENRYLYRLSIPPDRLLLPRR